MVRLYYTKTKKVVPMERPSCFITSNLAVFITILFFLQYLTCCKGEMRYSIRQNKNKRDRLEAGLQFHILDKAFMRQSILI